VGALCGWKEMGGKERWGRKNEGRGEKRDLRKNCAMVLGR